MPLLKFGMPLPWALFCFKFLIHETQFHLFCYHCHRRLIHHLLP